MMAEAYTPSLSLLAQSGLCLTSFQPEADVAGSLLYRVSLECGSIESPLSYYVSDCQGLGLLRLKSGSLLFTVLPAGQSAAVSERGLYLFDCRFTCRIIVRNAAEYEILRFDGPGWPYFRSLLPEAAPFWRIPPAVSQSGELLPLFEKKAANPVLCHMLLTEMLSRLTLGHMLPGKKAPSYLADMKSEPETHYYETHTLAEFEEKYRVNRYRLCREFKSHYQTPPLPYLHRIRIQSAKSLLAETSLKIHEISYEAGYENVNHFIAHFKKNTGMTPTEYRLIPR